MWKEVKFIYSFFFFLAFPLCFATVSNCHYLRLSDYVSDVEFLWFLFVWIQLKFLYVVLLTTPKIWCIFFKEKGVNSGKQCSVGILHHLKTSWCSCYIQNCYITGFHTTLNIDLCYFCSRYLACLWAVKTVALGL